MAKSLSLSAVLELTGGRSPSEGECTITGVASLLGSTANDLSFLGNKKYRDQIEESKAGVILVPEDFEVLGDQLFILCADPSSSFSQIIDFFAPDEIVYPATVHPTAYVSATASLGGNVHVGPNAVIEDGAEIGDNCIIGAGSYVGHYAKILEASQLHPNVTIAHRCEVGRRCIIHSSTVVGSDGFGFLPGAQGHTKIPQVGIAVLEDDVELGASVCVDRARFGKTSIGQGTKVDNLVQIAHNVEIGKHCFLVSQCGVAGSAEIGNFVVLAGQSAVAGHLKVGDGVTVSGKAGITKDVEAGSFMVGMPAVKQKEFVKERFTLRKIPRLEKELKALQAQVNK